MQFTPPSPISFEGNQNANWTIWQGKWEIFMNASESTGKSDKVKTSMLLNCIGERAVEVYQTFKWPAVSDTTPEPQFVYTEVIKQFEGYFSPRKNVTMSRFKFFTYNQVEGQSMNQFITEVKIRSKDCAFDTDDNLNENLVRDKIICGLRNKHLQEKLLRVEDMTLEKVIKHCQIEEEAFVHSRALKQEESVNAVQSKQHRYPYRPQQPTSSGRNDQERKRNDSSSSTGTCTYCGTSHPPGTRNCQAYGKTCNFCKRQHHFESVCSKKNVNANIREVTSPEQRSDSERDDNADRYYIYTVKGNSENDKWKFVTCIGNIDVSFKLDSGADVNILSLDAFREIRPEPSLNKTSIKLKAYNQTDIPIIGECIVNMKVNGLEHNVSFIIAEFCSIIGGTSCLELGLMKRINSVMNIDDDLFAEIGCMKTIHTLQVREGSIPVVHSPRRVPESLMKPLKDELDRMVRMGVASEMLDPTDWVSSLVLIQKPDGKLRVCLDPKDLNKALLRSHYPMPRTDDILNKMRNAKMFSKLDASSGYWQMRVDDESKKLLTFNTPFGRYCMNRVPFGIHNASELFQREMETMIHGIEGVACNQDDIIVWGKDEEEHDRRLEEVLMRIRASGLKLNKKKCQFRKDQLIFLGHKITGEGIEADPAKTEAISQMAPPKNKQELQRFLGMINYIGKFIPNLADMTAPLRELLQKDRDFNLSVAHLEAFEELKKLATSNMVLKSFDPEKDIVVSADASGVALGGALLQEHDNHLHPVAYIHRALTKIEQRYAQIEKECLSLVFATKRFHQYIYGMKFVCETDHKPLISIFQKEIAKQPARIQRMMFNLQSYPDMSLKYTPGSKLYIADTLSRCTYKDSYRTNAEDEGLEGIDYMVHMVTGHLPVSEEKLQLFAEETEKDERLKKLKQYIEEGWPSDYKSLPKDLGAYWGIQAELTVERGIILRGEQIVIPPSMRKLIKDTVHEGHLGKTKCKTRARRHFFWPGINAEIERFVEECEACQENRNQQPRESNIRIVTTRPWEIIGSDIFHFRNDHYLIVVDYYSGYPEIMFLGHGGDHPASRDVISKLKQIMAGHGCPVKMITDGGPQYTSEEFKRFAKNWEFKIEFSSPEYPRGNGKAERSVQTVKQIIRKCKVNDEDIWPALMAYRNTPMYNNELSPSEVLFGRQIRTRLNNHLQQKMIETELREFHDTEYPVSNNKTRDLPLLKVGDRVRVWKKEIRWKIKARVIEIVNKRSYKVKTDTGSILRRNRINLLKIPDQANNTEDTQSEDIDNEEDDEYHDAQEGPEYESDITDSESITSRSHHSSDFSPSDPVGIRFRGF